MTDQPHTTTPAPSPAWWTDPTPPAWVVEQLRHVSDWRNVGACRWIGQMAGSLVGPDLLVLVNETGNGFMQFAEDLELLGPDSAFLVDHLFRDMAEKLGYEALPECAKPDCHERAPRMFTAVESGPLAGRQRDPGEQIHFCPAHGLDVWRAASGGPIAAWLVPDAVRVDPVEALWAAGFANDSVAYAEAVAKLRRLTQFAPGPDA
jgi:hypothetical protein